MTMMMSIAGNVSKSRLRKLASGCLIQIGGTQEMCKIFSYTF
jgi:hypothetical protein